MDDLSPRHSKESFGSDTTGSFTFQIRLGLLFIVETAFLSALFVVLLLFFITWQVIWPYLRRKPGCPQRLSNIHVYFISLLCSDLLLSINILLTGVYFTGGIMNVRWGIVEGSYCTTQGILKQMGSVGVALSYAYIYILLFGVLILINRMVFYSRKSFFSIQSNQVIAVNTWGLITGKLSKPPSLKMAITTVLSIWLFVILMTSVGLAVHHTKSQPFYGNTGYWCWIRSPYSLREGIALQYGWLWLTAALNCILYISIALKLLGTRRRNIHKGTDTIVSERERSMKKIAFEMVLYPVIYMIAIVPSSIVRFIQFTKLQDPPFYASDIASIAFASSGILNVLLFSFTRPSLLRRREYVPGYPQLPSSGSPRGNISTP
ncbi:hypothetical protein SISNIDRAFT_467505 [Sistotremastrum niveocremeum HHB9708]|uniref:G-protein coupled receptors family 1 profile domain-containing protein n=1 Tax=Sistotremastrum niveocremeum HHB9708 TaxID=1314777 RepID=A0A164SKB6_9AGAM|nr:hypothetical protein SISNIDRAFT_467505 [Sistotremastrum niveocremeum HHB9708]